MAYTVRAAGYSIHGLAVVVYHHGFLGEYEALVIDPETDSTIIARTQKHYPTHKELERMVEKALEKLEREKRGVNW